MKVIFNFTLIFIYIDSAHKDDEKVPKEKFKRANEDIEKVPKEKFKRASDTPASITQASTVSVELPGTNVISETDAGIFIVSHLY